MAGNNLLTLFSTNLFDLFEKASTVSWKQVFLLEKTLTKIELTLEEYAFICNYTCKYLDATGC